MTKLMTELKETLATLKKSVGTAEALVSDMESEEKKEEEWPQEGERFSYVGEAGSIQYGRWRVHPWERDLKRLGNCFRHRKEA